MEKKLHEKWEDYTDKELKEIKKQKNCKGCYFGISPKNNDDCMCDFLNKTGKMRVYHIEECPYFIPKKTDKKKVGEILNDVCRL